MKFCYGGYEILFDDKSVTDYYAALPLQNTPANRNFKKYLQKLCDEDREVMNTLPINPDKVEIFHTLELTKYRKKPKEWFFRIQLQFNGMMVNQPYKQYVSVDELAKGDVGIENLNNRNYPIIHIGNMEIDIMDMEELFRQVENYDDDPSAFTEELSKGNICIEISGNADWYLDEACEDTWSDPNIFEQIGNFFHRLLFAKKETIALRKTTVNSIVYFAQKTGVELQPFTQEAMLSYKRTWAHSFSDNNDAIVHALPSKKLHNLLWHIFSFEDGKALEGKDAEKAYDSYQRVTDGVIYIDDVDTAFKARGLQIVDSVWLENLVDELRCCDIIVTAEDFSYTYCRTHEQYWLGPYFYINERGQK